MKLRISLSVHFFLLFFFLRSISLAQPLIHRTGKKIVIGNAKIRLTLDCNKQAAVSSLVVNGEQVITGSGGIYSEIKTGDSSYTTLHLRADPVISIGAEKVRVTGIIYGDKTHQVREDWTYTITPAAVTWTIERTLSQPVEAIHCSSPVFLFKNIHTWEGAYQDYGGLAWFYLFNQKKDTYGVHSSSSRFWNSKTGNGLTVAVNAPGREVAMEYSRTPEDQLACSVEVSPDKILPRLDSDTHRRRFLSQKSIAWEPVVMAAGKTSEEVILSWFDFKGQFNSGTYKGLPGSQVHAVLNTIARIGVIDKLHFGGNSWHTPYGPICLHEQYIAQLGLAINDPAYLKGYQQCLDFYGDNAVQKNGRVWPRWAYTNEDMMPGQVTDKGFYEARWGFLLDSNPDLVTNVAELYDQTGDKGWVKTHQQSCEKALDWILARDTNHNGLVEMMTDTHTQQQSSDWIDIIWASFENAMVNAKLYHALVLWADIEKQLGNIPRSTYYKEFAEKLKASFNKPISEGGFWDAGNSCYIHWRDKDGTAHGRNMVTPVNFMAIAYGICDQENRKKAILDKIEMGMQAEKLFFWPLCMSSYAAGEGKDWQFPFPNYENGDLFLSWGALGVQAYATYKPEIALAYVKNVLKQYATDGLAFQRYGRRKQDGLGDDILSGNSLSIIGLYKSVYGINPLYNRFYLDPHLTAALSGTRIFYTYRKQQLTIDLAMDKYAVSDSRFKISAKKSFGFFSSGNELSYFDKGNDTRSLGVKVSGAGKLSLDILSWKPEHMVWNQASHGGLTAIIYELNRLKPNSLYSVSVHKKVVQQIKTNANGGLNFNVPVSDHPVEIELGSL